MLKKIIREEISKVLNEQSKSEFTCLAEDIGAMGGEHVSEYSVEASNPTEAAKKCILNYHKMDDDPSIYNLDDLQGHFEIGNSRNPFFVLAVIEGRPNIPLKMTSTGLK